MARDKPLHNFLFETSVDDFYSGLQCYCTPWIDVCVILHLARRYQPARFLEIGTHRGFTTRILADKFPNMQIVTVDPGDRVTPDQRPPNQEGEYLPQHMIGELVAGYPNVTVIREHFCDVEWSGPQFDMVFIDGDHRAPAVLADSQLALKLLADPGVVVWHDYNNVRDVNTAIDMLGLGDRVCWLHNTWVAYLDTHPPRVK